MRFIFIVFALLPLALTAREQETGSARQAGLTQAQKTEHFLELSKSYAENRPDLAVYYANEGLRLAEKQSDVFSQAGLLLQLGRINVMHRHYDLARSFFNEALRIYRALRDAAGIASAFDELGVLEAAEKDSLAASVDFGRALQYYRDNNDSSGIIKTYEEIGRSFEKKGDSDKALSYYLRALKQYGHRRSQPEAYYILLEKISQLYLRKGNPTLAMQFIKEGLRESRQQALPDTELHLLNAEGEALEKEHDIPRALSIYKEALSRAKQYRDPEEQAQALIHIAEILKQLDVKSSERDLREALAIARKLGEPKLEANIYGAMAAVYRQEKSYSEAMAALEEQHHLLDSLLHADTLKDIAALDSGYEIVRSREKLKNLEHLNRVKRSELTLGTVLLIASVIILVLFWLYLRKVRQLNEELKNSNRIKDTLFSVVGHDLKGPAGNAVQLFELMESEDLSPEEMKDVVRQLHKQTSASLELLKSLFEWGKSQLRGVSVKPVNFDSAEVVKRCIDLLSRQAALKNIIIENRLADGLHIHADADHFEFIIRNLLSNAIKFTYEGGAIVINSQPAAKNKDIIFSVSDNGIGISKKQQDAFVSGNLQIRFGTGEEKGSGLGLLLTKDFIKANHGRLWLESEEGRGTTFYVALPVSQLQIG